MKSLKYTGRNNPNCKFKNINDTMFKVIDSEEKAYFLGWVASDGSIKNSYITIEIHLKDFQVLENIKNALFPELTVKKNRLRNRAILRVCSKEISKDVCQHLKVDPEKPKSFTVDFPEDLKNNKELGWAFIRGLFDGDGSVKSIKDDKASYFQGPVCSIASSSDFMKTSLNEFCSIPCAINKNQVTWSGVNALDFLGKIYPNNAILKLGRKYETYLHWCTWNPTTNPCTKTRVIDNIYWAKTDERATPPFKERVSDSGYDLTLISKVKESGNIIFYDTGLKVLPPFGYYFQLVGRSSLQKQGWMLANCIGIIDRSYRGSIKVALLKIDPNAKELELPFRGVQIVPAPIFHVDTEEVEDLENSERSDGGFGSTDS